MASPVRSLRRTVEFGNWLFHVRSFTPIPVLAALAWRVARTRSSPGFGGDAWEPLLNTVGWLVAFLGQALRFYTLGQVTNGTSGQGNQLEAVKLNTQGPYAYVRNPLYLGNLGICLGLMLIANDVWVYLLGLGFFFGEYFFIIRAEEAFLRRRFGEAFDEFTRRVPRWVPRLRPAYEGSLRAGFDLPRALKKEHNPFAAWMTGALILTAWTAWARGKANLPVLLVLAGAEAVTLVAFATIKAYKRGLLFRAAPRHS